MRNWQAWSGGAVWMLVATLMMAAALQPVELSAAMAACADGSARLVMGCESIHL